MLKGTEVFREADLVVGPQELEIKFSLKPGDLSRLFKLRLLDQTSFSRSQTLQTLYYDTDDGRLFAEGITLRWRKHGNRKPVMTLKARSKSGLTIFERVEIEVVAPYNGIDLDLFDDAVASQIKTIIDGQELIVRYATRFKRQAALITTQSSVFEIAVDDGNFIVGNEKWPLRELELELKSGDWSEMLDLARDLARKGQLPLEITGKSERCFILAGLSSLTRKTQYPSVRSDMHLDAAFATILNAGLMHFTAYIQPFRDAFDPRAVHQMRVGLRRLRAALKIFARSFPSASFQLFADRAREIADGLALARECDAFHDLAFHRPLSHSNCPNDAANLRTSLNALRTQAYEDARSTINSAMVTLFIIDLQAYIGKRGWRSEINDQQLSQLTETAEHFAQVTLGRLYEKARKRGKNLFLKSDEERHEFRIALKNLRYNSHFFSPLYKNRKYYKAWNAALVDLQESLGIQNDLASARTMLKRLETMNQGHFAYSAGFILGWYASQGELAEAKMVKQWKKVRKLSHFWD